ncbi:unnamed protein product [Bathycoccus prasinos]
MRTMLHDLGCPGIDHVLWKWTSKPLRRAIFRNLFPAFAYYINKHFGYEYTRMRKLIEKYDSFDALRKDETAMVFTPYMKPKRKMQANATRDI